MRCVFENSERRHLEEFDAETLIAQQEIRSEEYQIALNKLFYASRNSLTQVELFAASAGVIALSAVIKRYHCNGLSSVNECLQEVLLQTKLSSAYTCRLLDFSIHLAKMLVRSGSDDGKEI